VFLVCLFICTNFLAANTQPPCVAVEFLSPYNEEEWDFRIPFWENSTVSTASPDYNIIPYMNGTWTYAYSFCKSVIVYMGDNVPTTQTLGWSFGTLTSFFGLNVSPRINSTEYSAYIEFIQIFLQGDAGSPCTDDIPRSATVNVWCGGGKANCTQVLGNKGAACISASDMTNPGFCLCSVQYNTTFGICSGLTLNLLSNKCPKSYDVEIPAPAPIRPEGSRSVGIAFAILAVIVVVACIGGYIYNFTVHAKRGCQAIPFYDTCTGQRDVPYYTLLHLLPLQQKFPSREVTVPSKKF